MSSATMTSTTPAPATTSTVGEELKRSPAIRAAVEQILAEIRARTATITGDRPANPGKKESYDALMKRAADVRGRPLL